MNTTQDPAGSRLAPTTGSLDGWHAEYLKASDRAMQMEIERDDARRERDEWKSSAAQYHTANEWLDAERSKFIGALREIDPKHTLLPENAKVTGAPRTGGGK